MQFVKKRNIEDLIIKVLKLDFEISIDGTLK